MNSGETQLRELNFHLSISEHDYGVAMRHARKSLLNGVKVKLQLKFRGSEMSREEEGIVLIRRMMADQSGVGVANSEPRRVGKSIHMLLTPLAPG